MPLGLIYFQSWEILITLPATFTESAIDPVRPNLSWATADDTEPATWACAYPPRIVFECAFPKFAKARDLPLFLPVWTFNLSYGFLKLAWNFLKILRYANAETRKDDTSKKWRWLDHTRYSVKILSMLTPMKIFRNNISKIKKVPWDLFSKCVIFSKRVTDLAEHLVSSLFSTVGSLKSLE